MQNAMILRRKCVTLIEMIIVMFIIAVIISVVAYNIGGGLEESKAFATKAGIEKLENILNLAVANNPNLMDNIESEWQEVVKKSPLIKNPKRAIVDGWGNEYDVTVEDNIIRVKSEKFNDYKRNNPTMFGD